MDITTLDSSELEQVLIAVQERRQALEAGSRYYDTDEDRAWARTALGSVDSALRKLRPVSHEIKTVSSHSTFEVVFWHVLIGVLAVAFVVGMVVG